MIFEVWAYVGSCVYGPMLMAFYRIYNFSKILTICEEDAKRIYVEYTIITLRPSWVELLV